MYAVRLHLVRCWLGQRIQNNYSQDINANAFLNRQCSVVIMSICLVLLRVELPKYDPIELVDRYRSYRLPEPPFDATPAIGTTQDGYQFVAFENVGKKEPIAYIGWDRLDKPDHYKLIPLTAKSVVPIGKMAPDRALWPTIDQENHIRRLAR